MFRRLPGAQRTSYKEAKEALEKRFKPESKKELYMAGTADSKKKRIEDWAVFGEDLRFLAEKAYPNLTDDASEQIALNQYLACLDNHQKAFAVK